CHQYTVPLARRTNKNKGGGLINKLINKLPVELHVPAVAWGVTTAMKEKRKVGGGCGFKAAVKATKNVLKKNFGEKNLRKLTKKCVAVARKTYKSTKTKVPRIVNIPKKGEVLPIIPIFAGLSAFGALTGSVANVVKVANEFKRNVPSHLGNGLYLTPNTTRTKALYDFELKKIAWLLKIPHFIGVFTRDKLPVRPKRFESAIVNLDTVNGIGTHWVAYKKIEVENTAQICLLSLLTNNSIPNIEPGCNSMGFRHMFGVNDNITILTETYELKDLESVVNKLKPDYTTSFELKSDKMLYKLLSTGSTHESENTVNIMKINCIKIGCNLITDSSCNGSPSQTLQEFYLTVAVGYKIVEVPRGGLAWRDTGTNPGG
ncbi:protein ALP1-like, partial [Aphis craccivora]